MNKDNFVISASEHEKRMLYKRFCKDNNIPINLFEDPYFHSRLNLYDYFYHTDEKWEQLWEMLKDFNNVQDYFEYYDNVKDEVINKIKSSNIYNTFISYSNPANDNFVKEIKSKFEKRTLYSEVNDKKVFLSIDMKQANFNAMRYFYDMFEGKTNWKEYLSLYTPYEYIQNSKYIRQVILGNCNPRRQVSYATFLMCSLYEILEPLNFRCISIEADELVYELDLSEEPLDLINDPFVIDVISGIFESINELLQGTIFNNQIPLTIEIFRLYKIDGTKGYIKKCINNDFKIQNKLKCFNSVELRFVLRALRDDNIKPNDMIFYAGDINRIAILKDPINVLIPKDITILDIL